MTRLRAQGRGGVWMSIYRYLLIVRDFEVTGKKSSFIFSIGFYVTSVGVSQKSPFSLCLSPAC